MRPPSPALLALALALPLPARAVMCLKPGSLGPDVPNCTAYEDGPAAKTAVSDNLVSVAGDAAAESFNERLAEDLAGPFHPQRLLARAQTPASRAGLAPGVPSAPADLAAAGLNGYGADYDHIAGTIVKGTGNAFQAFETAKPGLQAAGASGAPAFPPAAGLPAQMGGAQTASVTPGSRAQTGSAGASRGMGGGGAVSIGSLTESDAGRGVFDNAAAGVPAEAGPAATRTPTVRDCTILHPCAKAD